jgi:hypothetical protein
MHHQPSSTSRHPAVDATRSVQLPSRAATHYSDLAALETTSAGAAAAAAPAKTVDVQTSEGVGNDLARSLAAVWEHVEVLKTRVAMYKEDKIMSGSSADL